MSCNLCVACEECNLGLIEARPIESPETESFHYMMISLMWISKSEAGVSVEMKKSLTKVEKEILCDHRLNLTCLPWNMRLSTSIWGLHYTTPC